MVFELIEALEAKDRLLELLAAAQRNNPGNVKLRDFIGSLPSDRKQGDPQADVVRQGPDFDWRGPTDERELEGLLRPQREVTS